MWKSRIPMLRAAEQMSQLELANRIGRWPQTISRWEKNPEEMRLKEMVELGRIFGVAWFDLVYDDEKEQAINGRGR